MRGLPPTCGFSTVYPRTLPVTLYLVIQVNFLCGTYCLLLHQVQGSQALKVLLKECLESFPDCTETFQCVCKLSKVSDNLSDFLETFQSIQKLSRILRFLQSIQKLFQIVRKLSRLSVLKVLGVQKLSRVSRTFPECLNFLKCIFKLSRVFGNFSECLETLKSVQKLSQLLETFQRVQKTLKIFRKFPGSP